MREAFRKAERANVTGGYSTAGTNDVEQGIKQIFRENASYYMLGFQSTNAKADGKFRRVEVAYRLRLEATQGKTTAVRDSRFTVR